MWRRERRSVAGRETKKERSAVLDLSFDRLLTGGRRTMQIVLSCSRSQLSFSSVLTAVEGKMERERERKRAEARQSEKAPNAPSPPIHTHTHARTHTHTHTHTLQTNNAHVQRAAGHYTADPKDKRLFSAAALENGDRVRPLPLPLLLLFRLCSPLLRHRGSSSQASVVSTQDASYPAVPFSSFVVVLSSLCDRRSLEAPFTGLNT